MLIVIHQISEIAVLGLINLGTNSKPKRVTLWFWSSFGIYSKSIKSIIASWLNHMENKLSGTSGSAAELVAHTWCRRAGKGCQIPLGLSPSVYSVAR